MLLFEAFVSGHLFEGLFTYHFHDVLRHRRRLTSVALGAILLPILWNGNRRKTYGYDHCTRGWIGGSVDA